MLSVHGVPLDGRKILLYMLHELQSVPAEFNGHRFLISDCIRDYISLPEEPLSAAKGSFI